MLPIRPTSQFKKDFKKAVKQGRKTDALAYILDRLAKMESLPSQYQDHKLKGNWRDFRECHIEPDLLLIYAITDFELRPTRLGSHSELFG